MVLINLSRTVITALGILLLLVISQNFELGVWGTLLVSIPIMFIVFMLGDLSDQKLYEYFNQDG